MNTREISWIRSELEDELGVEIDSRRNAIGGYDLTALSKNRVALGRTLIFVDWDGIYGSSILQSRTGCFTEPAAAKIVDQIAKKFMDLFAPWGDRRQV